jgi:hypothetical protein
VPAAALVGQVEPLGLPAAGLEIHDEHTVLGCRHGRARRRPGLQRAHVASDCVPSERHREHEQSKTPHQ